MILEVLLILDSFISKSFYLTMLKWLMKSFKTLNKQQRANFIKEQLIKDFPEANTPLDHKGVFQLLCAVMLSAQTLDTTVNKVTPELFLKYPDVDSMAKAKSTDIIKIIRIVNFHKTKAQNLVKMSQMLLEKFKGKVPHTIDELTTLPGVGRKTANVIISEWFAKKDGVLPEGFVVDTHVKRVSKNLGLTNETDPKKVEQDLMKLFDRKDWNEMSLRLIFHGRFLAKARGNVIATHPVWKKVYEDLGLLE